MTKTENTAAMSAADKEEKAARAAADEKAQEDANRRSMFDFLGRMPDLGSMLMWGVLLLGGYFLARNTELGRSMLGQLFGGEEKVDAALVSIDGFFSAMLEMVGIQWDMRSNIEAMPLEDVQKYAKDTIGLPDAAIQAIAGNKDKLKDFLDVVAGANGGKVTTNGLMNDKTLYALMTQRKDLMKSLAESFQGTLQTGASLGKSEKKLLASVRNIIVDDRLDILLSTHQTTTINTLKVLLPPSYEDAIDLLPRLIESSKDTNGTIKPDFRTLLSDLLTVKDDKLPDPKPILEAYAKKHPELAAELVKEGAMKNAELIAFVGKENVGLLIDTFRQQLGGIADAQLIAVANAQAANDWKAVGNFVLDHRPAFAEFLNKANKGKLSADAREGLAFLVNMPDGAVAPIKNILANGVAPQDIAPLMAKRDTFIPIAHALQSQATSAEKTKAPGLLVDILTDPNTAALVRKAGPENIVALAQAYAKANGQTLPSMLTSKNLQLIADAGEAISRDGRDVQEKEATETVIKTVLYAHFSGTDPKHMFDGIAPQKLALFMQNPTNQNVLKNLLDANGIEGRNDEQSAASKMMLEHWNVLVTLASTPEGAESLVRNGPGFMKVMQDPASAQIITAQMKHAKPMTADSCNARKEWYGGFFSGVADIGTTLAGYDIQVSGGTVQKNALADHAKEVNNLRKALVNAQCSALEAKEPESAVSPKIGATVASVGLAPSAEMRAAGFVK